MNRKISLYFWEKSVCPVGKKPRKTYYLRSIMEDMDEVVFTDLISLADYVVASCKKVDSMIIFCGLNNRVENKPYVKVYRGGTTLVRSDTCKGSLLSKLNDEILTLLEEASLES